MPTQGKKRGDVLISYLTEPFTLAPWEPLSNFHTMYWECKEIAKLFTERGYTVDIINWNDATFIPKKSYCVCIDVQNNLERLSQFLPKNCKKIMHIVSSYAAFQNKAENKRLDELYRRRGIRLSARRTMPVSRNPEFADFLEGFGNQTVHDTYKHFEKTIFPIPISAVKLFDFPEKKDFESARKHFLWFGGGGMVHKGLDILLEAFAQNPSLHLYLLGPLEAEKDFVMVYKKVLRQSPNITTHARIDVTSNAFKEITLKCAAIIYPSCSEGTSGSVIQAIHAGLVPIITPETGISPKAGGIILKNPTVESINKTINEFATLPANMIKNMARNSWSYVRVHHTRENFSKEYARFINEILKL
jgi:glycosyltransferase involved in cell wall biosynthesis